MIFGVYRFGDRIERGLILKGHQVVWGRWKSKVLADKGAQPQQSFGLDFY